MDFPLAAWSTSGFPYSWLSGSGLQVITRTRPKGHGERRVKEYSGHDCFPQPGSHHAVGSRLLQGSMCQLRGFPRFCLQCHSKALLFPTLCGTSAHQAPLSMGFLRQEYMNGLPFCSPVDLPGPGTEPASPALAGRFFTTEPPGEPTSLPRLVTISFC